MIRGAAITAFLTIILCSLLLSCHGPEVVPVRPPDPRVEVQGTSADLDAVWIPGYWRHKRGEWIWVPGYWERPPRSGSVWISGNWAPGGGGWIWIPGHWENR